MSAPLTDAADATMLAYWCTVLRQPLGTFRPGETREDRAEDVARLIGSYVAFASIGDVPVVVTRGRMDRPDVRLLPVSGPQTGWQ